MKTVELNLRGINKCYYYVIIINTLPKVTEYHWNVVVGTVHLNNRNEEFLTQTEELDHRKLLLSSFDFYW